MELLNWGQCDSRRLYKCTVLTGEDLERVRSRAGVQVMTRESGGRHVRREKQQEQR